MGAVVAIFFDVEAGRHDVSEKEEKVIDAFFDSLKWDKTTTNPVVDEIKWGDMIMLQQTLERWSYKGSLTTPPCTQNVYWNVYRRVLPIKQKHLDLFNKQLERNEGLSKTGNWRVPQALTADHDIAWHRWEEN